MHVRGAAPKPLPKFSRMFQTQGDPIVKLQSGFTFSSNQPGRHQNLKSASLPQEAWGDAKPKSLSFESVVTEYHADHPHYAHSVFDFDWGTGTLRLDTNEGREPATVTIGGQTYDAASPPPATLPDGSQVTLLDTSLKVVTPGQDVLALSWTYQIWPLRSSHHDVASYHHQHGGQRVWYLNAKVQAKDWPKGSLYGVLGSVQDFGSGADQVPDRDEPRTDSGDVFTYSGKKGTDAIVEDIAQEWNDPAARTSPEQVKWRTPFALLEKFKTGDE